MSDLPVNISAQDTGHIVSHETLHVEKKELDDFNPNLKLNASALSPIYQGIASIQQKLAALATPRYPIVKQWNGSAYVDSPAHVLFTGKFAPAGTPLFVDDYATNNAGKYRNIRTPTGGSQTVTGGALVLTNPVNNDVRRELILTPDADVQNQEWWFHWQRTSLTIDQWFHFFFRSSGAYTEMERENGYNVTIEGLANGTTGICFEKATPGVRVRISPVISIPSYLNGRCHLLVNEDEMKVKVWPNNSSEPSEWTVTATDLTHATGDVFMAATATPSTTWRIHDINAVKLADTEIEEPPEEPPPPPPPPPSGTRNIFVHPGHRDNPANRPIGSNAQLVYANLAPATVYAGRMTEEIEVIGLDPNAPLNPCYSWGEGDVLPDGVMAHVPDNVWAEFVPGGGYSNNTCAFLNTDGYPNEKIIQGQHLDRRGPNDDPTWEWTNPWPPVALRGTDFSGQHGGSYLSNAMGSIMPGELTGPDPIRHVLKMSVFVQRFLSQFDGGYRWPAQRADHYWQEYYGINGNPPNAMRMGALLTTQANYDLSWLTNWAAYKWAWAVKHFGVYIVDDTDWDVYTLDMHQDSHSEFTAQPSAFHEQMQQFMTDLYVVNNNSPSSVGGGGTPRYALAPDPYN